MNTANQRLLSTKSQLAEIVADYDRLKKRSHLCKITCSICRFILYIMSAVNAMLGVSVYTKKTNLSLAIIIISLFKIVAVYVNDRATKNVRLYDKRLMQITQIIVELQTTLLSRGEDSVLTMDEYLRMMSIYKKYTKVKYSKHNAASAKCSVVNETTAISNG